MIDVSVYNLYCFAVLAQQLNYTKAAEILNISQPALSKNIHSLEQKLGVSLFYRNTRVVNLTDAGENFYIKISRCLNDINGAVSDTRDIANGRVGVLRIGFLPYAFSDTMPKIVQEYRRKHPHVNLIIQDGEEYHLEKQLLSGEIDIALVSDWGIRIPDRFVQKVLYQDDYNVVLNKNHPLADRESVSFDMLRKEKFLTLNQNMISDPLGAFGSNNIVKLCTEKGFLPNIASSVQAKTLIGLCIMAGCNEGICILASHMEKFVAEDYYLKFIPISDINLRFHALACYSKDTSNMCVKEFIDIVSLLY